MYHNIRKTLERDPDNLQGRNFRIFSWATASPLAETALRESFGLTPLDAFLHFSPSTTL
jgi:hypothetical protein